MTPRTPSFADFDRPYRRGLVLGLSLAELFLILLFLLLLAAVGYSAIVEEEMDEDREKNNQLSQEKAVADARAVAAEDARDTLVDKLSQAEKALGNVIEREDPLNLIVGLQARIAKLETQVDQLTPAAEFGGKIREAAREGGVKPSDVIEIIEDMAQPQSTIENLQSQLADAKKDIHELRRQLAEPDQEKGQHPPCWYKIVTRPNGKPRERGLYIFHVIISDDHVFVKDIPAPTREYVLQKTALPFNRSALNKNISFGGFVKSFMPLKDAGENGKVQDYRCKFYVKVWEATTSKKKYKHALEKVVQSIFFTYLVKDEAWPY